MRTKPDQQARDMRAKVFHNMLETRGWKYRAFLRYLCFFKYIALAPTRGEFLESYYTLMRYLDDVVDGDVPVPEGYSDASEYLSEKIEFSNNPVNPKDEVDSLILYCYILAKKFGADFRAETMDILDALLFDAKRHGKGVIYPKEELAYHFHLLDVRGTIRATLKVFNDDPQKYTILEPLGIACRYQFDLEDFEADVAAGYVNISFEECECFGIRKEDLYRDTLPNIKAWQSHHAREGMALLMEHHRVMPEGRFSLLERAVFKVVYEIPARKVFLKFLPESRHQYSDKSYG
jgi:hypothetical protein